jgi:hypothetical protein
MPDNGCAGSVGSAAGFTDLGQPSRESEGERLEISCELDEKSRPALRRLTRRDR